MKSEFVIKSVELVKTRHLSLDTFLEPQMDPMLPNRYDVFITSIYSVVFLSYTQKEVSTHRREG